MPLTRADGGVCTSSIVIHTAHAGDSLALVLLLVLYWACMPDEPKQNGNGNGEIIEAIGMLSTQMDRRFEAVDERFLKIDGRFERIEEKMATKEDIRRLELRTEALEAGVATHGDIQYLATKDDLLKLEERLLAAMDEKNADLKGDLTILLRKEDRKLLALVDALLRKGALSREEVKHILGMEPFPQPMLS